tara:strand:+ start:4168 stop:4377 length:210 start_codon:yes stop_codon:yes gene_type:complete
MGSDQVSNLEDNLRRRMLLGGGLIVPTPKPEEAEAAREWFVRKTHCPFCAHKIDMAKMGECPACEREIY